MKKTLLIIFLIITILNCDPDKLNPYGIDGNEEENFRNIVLFLALRPSLTYEKTQLIFIKNINTSYTPILRNASIAGGSFMISPNISNTLSFNTSTGIISGTPTLSQTKSVYIVDFINQETQIQSNPFNIFVEESEGSGACNTTGIFSGCDSKRPFSCSDAIRPAKCYFRASDCQNDVYCY
ncbi:hypothetical protein GS518_01875 [Leptospira interrogans]|uniref:Lipoprotein n=7 Tax=Leptospira interrogans TaxID=173 RepID=Q8F8X8_LEPIN|nr:MULTISPECIES: putative Ig domain-containing protein [Leptospira]APH40364.1 Uncharacterized protein A9P81_0408 [Leptospira interrogans serovar Copenhageni/Icterohaemorrhagiae]EMN31796.1 hypothetical protein LEP1GSC083_3483 [Leptospira interrogans serovar Pyrogenes str. L0374]AAN47620.1 hypothetical protein LA_0421 [Leptospira interrogans serovar Lai str. 56601]AAS68994.1 conserved hypothetical protein [Leptospira interrogans serovar Copenhageni str. Fiocruz L1-130]AER01175.1 hypothetical pro